MTRILGLLLVAVAPAVSAATYFVATNGVDGNAGTEARPWKSLRKASASVQPGDTVRIRAGDYFVGLTWIVDRAWRLSTFTNSSHGPDNRPAAGHILHS